MAILNPRQSARKLRDSGLDEPQADAIVEVAEEVADAADEAIAEAATAADTALKEATGDLVTKEYLDARLGEFRAEMRAEFEKQRAEMRTQLADIRTEMYRGQNRLMVITFGMATTIALIAIAVVEFM